MSVKNFLPGVKKGKKKSDVKKNRRKSGSGSHFRDFRGIDGVLKEMEGRQTTDSNNE